MAAVLKYFSPAARPFHASKKRYGREEAQARAAYSSTAVYVGNLAFVTTDSQVHALFSRCGPVDRIVMGLNKVTRMPCGFAFVIFASRASAVDAVVNLHGTVLDERVIKVEMDKGFYEGRQYGRGESGGQVRDELRAGYDEGRGGYGAAREAAALVAAAAAGGAGAYVGGGYEGNIGLDDNGDAGAYDGDLRAASRRFSANLLPPGASLMRSGGDDYAAGGRRRSVVISSGGGARGVRGGPFSGQRSAPSGGRSGGGERAAGGKRRRGDDDDFGSGRRGEGRSGGLGAAVPSPAGDAEGGAVPGFGFGDVTGAPTSSAADEATREEERARRRAGDGDDVPVAVGVVRGRGRAAAAGVDEFGRDVRGDDDDDDGGGGGGGGGKRRRRADDDDDRREDM